MELEIKNKNEKTTTPVNPKHKKGCCAIPVVFVVVHSSVYNLLHFKLRITTPLSGGDSPLVSNPKTSFKSLLLLIYYSFLLLLCFQYTIIIHNVKYLKPMTWKWGLIFMHISCLLKSLFKCCIIQFKSLKQFSIIGEVTELSEQKLLYVDLLPIIELEIMKHVR